jgi:UDP-galactopyranose mutase
MIDYLIVGSGLYGSVFAREMTNRGYRCLVLEKRNHIGGNVFTENIEGINVHKYGAHIFHTNDKNIWDYVNKFAAFNNYKHKVYVKNNNKLYSFPINLLTFEQLWGINTPREAKIKFSELSHVIEKPENFEDWILSQIGTDLYELFIKEYTQKQWGRDTKDLPASIIKRIPIRTNLNDFYFDDLFQGIPIGGYTKLIENLLSGIEVKLGVDFIKNKLEFIDVSKNIVFTGAIDEYFNFCLGPLEYRSLNFIEKIIEEEDFQGTSVINYTDRTVPFTRILEHKHFEFGNQKVTVISEEHPLEWKLGLEPFYPVNSNKNSILYNNYKKMAIKLCPNVIFGGRLAEYRYYDMHQVVASALAKVKSIIEKNIY